eukprot:4396202-Prymnesium_polylepis.1
MIVTPDVSHRQSIRRQAPVPNPMCDEKSGVTIMVNDIMRGVNPSPYRVLMNGTPLPPLPQCAKN